MKAPHDPLQTSQRLRVGLIGLAVVVLLIGLASAIIGSATQGPVQTVSAEVAANQLADNAAEPLAVLGATPGTPDNRVAAAP